MLKKFTAAILAAALAISSAGVPQLAYGKEVEAHVTPNDAVESQGGGVNENGDFTPEEESFSTEDLKSAEKAVSAEALGSGEEPVSVEAPGSGEESVSTEEPISMEGLSPVGDLLAESLNGKLQEQEQNEGCNIFSAEVTGTEVAVTFETTMDAALTAAIYDEAGMKMLASGSLEVMQGETQAVVSVDTDSMPQYFYLRCFLVDSETMRPLCTSYESPNYTQEMQEFLAKTTEDFDSEKVLNLDEDNQNNFVVYSDQTKIIPHIEGKNRVVMADDASRTYVMEYADENITSLMQGDLFSYEYEPGNVLLVKIGSIVVDTADPSNTVVTITGVETSMEEAFEYVKIAGQANGDSATVDASNLGEGVTYEGMKEAVEDEIQTYALEGEGSFGTELSFKFAEAKIESKDENAVGSISGSISVGVKCSMKLYLSLSYQYLEVKIDYTGKLNISVSGKVGGEIPLAYIGFAPIPGVVQIGVTPSFVAEGEVKGDMSGKLTGTIGFSVDKDQGLKNLTSAPKLKAEVKGEATIFIGLSLEPNVTVFHEKVVDISVKGKLGGEVKATLDIYKTPSSSKKHDCEKCLDGEIAAKAEASYDIKLLNSDKLKFKNKAEISVKLWDFYYSFDYNEFAFTSCPHLSYKVTVAVKDQKGSLISGANVNGSYITESDGKISFYLPNGKHTVAVAKSGYRMAEKNVTVQDDGKSVVVTLVKEGSGQDSGGETSIDGKKVVQISLGNTHSGAITEDGNLYMWGYWHGQLGTGSSDSSSRPVEVLKNVKSVGLGGAHGGVIMEDGSLYMWGWNGPQTGATNNKRPVKLLENVKSVSLGDGHSGAITEDGSLYMWGYNGSGQLGNGTTDHSNLPVKILTNVKSVSLGNHHSGAITEDGSLYMWGYNGSGQLGNGTTENSNRPVKVMENVKSVSLGEYDSGAIMEDGSLYMWGDNGSGKLGTGTTVSSSQPVKVLENVKSVSLRGNHSGAITEDGSLYMWGYNWDGQLGNGTTEDSNRPVKVMENVRSISLGLRHSGVITEDGSLYMWGWNEVGQLGTGTTENSSTPIKITGPADTPTLSALTDSAAQPTYAASRTQSTPNITTDPNNSSRQIASYTNLSAGETYNFYVLKSQEEQQLLSPSNLLYIRQEKSDENGNLTLTYESREPYDNPQFLLIGSSRTDLAAAEIRADDILYDKEEHVVNTTVICNGILLTEGEDYELSGQFSATDIGTYTVTVEGIGMYTGSASAQYQVYCSHSYDNGTITKEPTCTQDGKQTLTCRLCQHTEQQSLQAKGHSYASAWTTDQAATCSQPGSKSRHCTVCGEKTDVTAIAKLSHNYGQAIVTKGPTCTQAGEQTLTCRICHHTEKKSLPAKGHSYDSAWTIDQKATCSQPGSKSRHCTVCGARTEITVIAKLPHTYGSRIVKTKATAKKNGKQVRICKVCKAESADVIYAANKIKLSATKYTYNGKAKKPSVTVRDSKGKKLKKGTDYTVSYAKGRKNVGNYTVTITFKGRYKGSVKKTFTIVPKSTNISRLKAKGKIITVQWKKQPKQTTGYEIAYSTSSKFTKKTTKKVTVSKAGTTSKRITKLKAKKKYYVRIRTYKKVKVNGKSVKRYGSWSRVKTIRTK